MNAGDNPLSLTADQRGGPFVRQFGSQADVGAFELQSVNGGGNDIVVTAPGPGVPGILRIVNAITQDDLFPALSIEPYPGFLGGVRVAVGDVSGDGTPDIITAAGPGGGPHVKVFDGETGGLITGPLGSFFAYDAGFTGGVFVAAGDVSGDGRIDLITAPGAGGGPHVRVFDGTDGSVFLQFFAYDASFTGGVGVAASDITGDGRADILTAPGQGLEQNVRAFDAATGDLIRDVPAADPQFTGSIFIAGSVVQESSGSPLRLAEGFLANDSVESLTLGLLKDLPDSLELWRELHSRFDIDLFLGIWLRDWNRGFSLTAETLTMLADRKLEIGFDIYCDVTQPELDFRTEAEQTDEREPE